MCLSKRGYLEAQENPAKARLGGRQLDHHAVGVGSGILVGLAPSGDGWEKRCPKG